MLDTDAPDQVMLEASERKSRTDKRSTAQRAPLSVIIPAYNEERVIERCLRALLDGADPSELDVIVSCNGCVDGTADAARQVQRAFQAPDGSSPVRVIETSQASKVVALNSGDEAARHFPRFYIDADVVVDVHSLRAMAAALDDENVLAVSPRMDMELTQSSWGVRAFYRVWSQLPYTREGMIGVGSYGLSRAGRARFSEFPDVIADDGFVRLQFRHGERVEVEAATVRVTAPQHLPDLIKIKTRSRLGGYQLRQEFPDLISAAQAEKSYGGALGTLLLRPWMWPHALVYLGVNLIARRRASRQFANNRLDVWERDESSR